MSLATVYDEFERIQARNDDDDEEKKKRFKKILHALLQYHTLPAAIGKPGLYANSTYETALEAHDGSYDGQPRRISVLTGLLGLRINFYVGVEWTSVAAENGEGSMTFRMSNCVLTVYRIGFLYGINKPIIPPPSILDELFFADNFGLLVCIP